MPHDQQLAVLTADRRVVPSQSWALAFWPDGSVKWSGLAITADESVVAPLTVSVSSRPSPITPLHVIDEPESVEISTGSLVCRIPRKGSVLIDSLVVDGRQVATNGRLIAIREDRSDYDSKGTLRQERYTGEVNTVTVEQSGPVRAVVRIEGFHASSDPARKWLPFNVRLCFTAGCNSIRVVHSFVFDGDDTDFIRGLGLAFTVPFREEKQNRHVRFAADGDGFWSEPVLMSPGYRPQLVKDAVKMNTDQMAGKRIPNLKDLDAKTKAQFETIAIWDAFKLNQLAPDSFAIAKRTGQASSWLHAMNGHRANGFVFLGDVSGALAVGVRRFWEKYPSSFEITGAGTTAGELKVWLWAPDAPAMDLRRSTLSVTTAQYPMKTCRKDSARRMRCKHL
jgi:hypothetical protein